MEVAKVVIIGIVLVFLILVLLTFLLMLFQKAAGGKSRKETAVLQQETSGRKSAEKQAEPEDLSLISVLTAAVAAYRSAEGEESDPNRFKVVAFRKTPRREMK